MAIVNSTVKLSGSSTGLPIQVTTADTLIHTASTNITDTDYVWLWVGFDEGQGYLNEITYIKVIKSNGTTSVTDSVIEIKPNTKNLIEAGVYLQSGLSIKLKKEGNTSLNVYASGYVHRRTESL